MVVLEKNFLLTKREREREREKERERETNRETKRNREREKKRITRSGVDRLLSPFP